MRRRLLCCLYERVTEAQKLATMQVRASSHIVARDNWPILPTVPARAFQQWHSKGCLLARAYSLCISDTLLLLSAAGCQV